MTEHQNPPRFGTLLALLFPILLLILGTGWSHAQEIEEVRHYLSVRDQLIQIKAMLESSITGEPGTGLLADPAKEKEILARLDFLDGEIHGMASMTGPLAGYYSERLTRLAADCRVRFSQFVQRLALGVREPGLMGAPAAPVPAPVVVQGPTPGPVTPAVAPAPTALPAPETPAPAAIPAPATPASLSATPAPGLSPVPSLTPAPEPVPAAASPSPAIGVPLPMAPPVPTVVAAPVPVDLAGLRTRREFFHPIGFRILLDPRMKRGPGKKSIPPLRFPPVPELPPTSIPASVVASLPLPPPVPIKPVSPPVSVPASAPVAVPTPAASAPVAVFPQLPSPIDSFPVTMRPLEPWSGQDPQVRETPGMRPLAVMIENHSQARPQTALDEAEVVYEIPVEGGITRFMAMFYHVPGVIGPVRSCREYFLDRALEVNALYVHCGGSPSGYAYIGKQKAFAIDEISNGAPFFRDSSRKAPHNLYTKGKDLIEVMNRKYPMQLPYQRLPLLYGPNPTSSGPANRGVSIRYHGNYTAAFRFNPRYGLYDRFMNGNQHLDRVSLKPVSPGTVVIQEAAMRVIDDKGRQEISFIGEGKAFILHGGTITPVTWKKPAVREFTRFYDQQGGQVVFSAKAPTWIQVVSPQNPVVFDPPLPQVAAVPGPAAAPSAMSAGPAPMAVSQPAAVPPTHVPAPPEGQPQ